MKHIKCFCLTLVVFLLIIGCAGDYGTLKRQTSTDNKMTLAELRENWEDYHIYHCMVNPRPSAIMFDPKNDDTRLVGDTWIKIADQQTLSETMEIIETFYGDGEVVIIEGPEPDRRFFGYMYDPFMGMTLNYYTQGKILLKMVDEQTLYVGYR